MPDPTDHTPTAGEVATAAITRLGELVVAAGDRIRDRFGIGYRARPLPDDYATALAVTVVVDALETNAPAAYTHEQLARVVVDALADRPLLLRELARTAR